MTRIDAIEFGESRKGLFGGKMEEFIKLSVEALKEQQLKGQRIIYLCENAVSRQDIKKYLSAPNEKGERIIYEDDLKLLSPVQPIRPKGHWIIHKRHRECSECKVWLPKDMLRNSYCPNCGAEMILSTESEE